MREFTPPLPETCLLYTSPLRQVSRHHARVYLSPEGAVVEDLDSKNGTYVNGHRIQALTALDDGDELQISMAQHFVYLSSDATMPLEGLSFDIQKRRLRVDVGARRVLSLIHI